MKKMIQYWVKNEELKTELDKYAKARGFKNIGSMSKVALVEYIRRRTDKSLMTVLQQALEEGF